MVDRGSEGAALQQAAAALQRGDAGTAEAICRRILQARPGSFDALFLIGIAAGQAGRGEEAVRWLARAVQLQPRHADARYNHGVALGAAGRHAEALAAYEAVLQVDPRRTDAAYNRGVALDALGRTPDALAAYEAVIAREPGHAPAHHNRGVALTRLGRAEEALAAFDRALALRPGYAAALNHRGAALAALGRLEEACESYRAAIAAAPQYAPAHNHLAMALLDLDRAEEALASAERAVALAPALADAWYTRGNALRELYRHAEAAESHERAVALDPAHAAAHWNLADCRLLLGDFARGWEHYEWRSKLPSRGREFAQPPWTGAEPLEGRTILLHAELGMGDTLQFARYIPEVARLGARVILEAQAPLVPLLRTLGGVAQWVARGEPLPPFDLHCPLMSLPLALRPRIEGIPAPIPYLSADPARVRAWRERLGKPRGPRVGVVWSGSQGLRNDKRSMALADAAPLLVPGIEWLSLQKDVRAADASMLADLPQLRDLSGELGDFAETAAVVELLDLLVSVDTSVPHVAGALGKPVWILLNRNPHDWRWHLEREDSAWYPQARIFRQPAAGDWASVVSRVRGELSRRFDV